MQTDNDLQSIGGAAVPPSRVPRERMKARDGRELGEGTETKSTRCERDDLSRRCIVDCDAYGFPAWRVNTRTDKGSRVIYEGTSS